MSSNSRITGGSMAPNGIPHSVHKLISLARVDYADSFSLSFAQDCPRRLPEQWIRAMFGDVPNSQQKFIWTGLLGLPLLQGRSPTTVAGWKIGKQDEDGIRIENQSWLLSANLIVHQTPDIRFIVKSHLVDLIISRASRYRTVDASKSGGKR
ncbi:unnamed protein product [Clonostachys rosea]|uniref:Uncharacterized protein n=1 Tax=Bionectria ochroleuca TaxID=29856 RepID=A0ABY6TQY3_BIOOC|nr:unnamed protein product [Clonostachys rosea]